MYTQSLKATDFDEFDGVYADLDEDNHYGPINYKQASVYQYMKFKKNNQKPDDFLPSMTLSNVYALSLFDEFKGVHAQHCEKSSHHKLSTQKQKKNCIISSDMRRDGKN
ncbi:CLUMA_CG012883, isoform A [Clunio marinus]|uniref:CLUMA_CG012883, isoform A n=1 Tax=Clunio marinus TaxID=568069 RepID=A0A1J1IM72_9DIPT|nr:CLUMA_CG012883, isoform A [Clunio marinus]